MRSTVTNTRLMELRKVVGNEFVDGLLKVFLDDAPVALSTIRGSADSEDLDALVFESHRLLSMCRNLGFDGMSTLCQRIEDEGRCGRIDIEALGSLEAQYDGLRAEIEATAVVGTGV